MAVKTYRTSVQLAGLPKNIWALFMPGSQKELDELEERLGKLSEWEKLRNQVITLQRQYGLPFKPNMSLQETLVRVNIEILRYKNNQTGYDNLDDDNQPAQ